MVSEARRLFDVTHNYREACNVVRNDACIQLAELRELID